MSTDVYTHNNKNMTIDRIEFGVLGNKEIKEMSVIKDQYGISKPEAYNNFEPVIGGLVDKRLGITDSHLECATCGHGAIKCPGHFGHVELAEPVYHIGYIPYIKKILGCICIKCSKLLVYKNKAEIEKMLKNKSGKARFAEIKNLCKSVSYCQQANYGCGAPVPKIKVDIKKSSSAINIIAETNLSTLSTDEQTGKITDGKKKVKQMITPEMCYSILKNISDIDCEIMGLNPKKTRPEMMILKMFPVPPIQIRPSAKADFLASATFEDDLTLKLADIINSNIRIRKYKEKEGKHSMFGSDTLYLLQYHVATFFDNDSVSLLKSEQRNGKPTKSVSARLKTKEGRVRGNLMGKRVDFSSRTVIGPDPNIDINELGVPLKIAMNLTFPEVVTPYNIDRLSELVRNGRDTYPGANFVFPISSFTSDKKYIIDLRYRKENVLLRFGDVVERHIVNGDLVLFNRQPSLHKLSMMAHKIRVIPNKSLSTFKLNLAVTPPYNADFDGDEMNMFVPQSIQTQVELDLIANVQRQIISPGTSAPVIGCVQDAALGSYLFTAEGNEIDWRNVMNLMMYTTLDKTKVDKKKKYSGKDIFSRIIPSKINMSAMTDAGKVVIRNGEIKEGRMSKKTVGASKNSIIHMIWNEYGMEETKKFIDNTQRLINNWLLQNGFTVSLGDTFIPDKLTKQIQSIVETKKLEVNHLITEMENNPEVMEGDIFERNIAAELNAIGGTINELIYNNLTEDNSFFVTITSKSKGSKLNLGQIAGIVGQQNVEGKRIRKRVNNRTLYHFHQNDDSALARGFCQNSYLDGLSPQEFYFHTMAGREGLIDTAIKSVTGDTPIVISENGVSKRVLIGDWIDGMLDDESNKPHIQHIEERDMELLELDQKKVGKLYIPTTDENGTTSWGSIKNITRHDPGKELYKITTLGGRNVIVTESKSLLIWDETKNKFLRKSTPEVVEGDFVPVTMNLPEYETISNNQIDMTEFFPKNKYIYGTDFEIAVDKMNKILKDNKKFPSGWWDKNNGKEFTLPYKYSHRLRRVVKRSNAENIKKGCFYPYAAARETAQLPDKLELNRENGLFLGLFLAEGNTDIKSGYVAITNTDKDIRKFVINWFSKFSVNYKESSKVNNIGGISVGVRGYSRLLGQFLTKIVGHGSRNKFVPDKAFTAPKKFIIGLLDGYFSGDGTVTKNSIQVTSASKRLLIGINMLLSRLGIFGKIGKTSMKKNNLGTLNIAIINTLSIRGQWATKFAETITLLLKSKNDKLSKIKPSDQHRNYREHNDVVLDPITSIEKVGIKKYPKVYDLTIPSTLNFGLANGLHVVDTADTGYIQRKLVKALEDILVKYDGTVRNSNDTVIQFMYGDNNINPANQVEHKLNIVNMNNKDILEKYKFTPEQLKSINKNGKGDFTNKDNNNLYNSMIKVRDDLRRIQRNATLNYITINDKYMLPVDLHRIINNVKYTKLENDKNVTLEPQYVLDRLDTLLKSKDTRIICMSKKQRENKKSLKYVDEMDCKTLLRFSLFEYLSPKRCIYEYKLNKMKFDTIIKNIISDFQEARVQAGEMVGVVAAQSIGEPATQIVREVTDSTIYCLKTAY